MKKFSLLGALLIAACVPAVAQDIPSTSTTLWDQSPWDNEGILTLFEQAYNDGRNYPTKAEFEAIGLTMDLEFVRSHTRMRSLYKDAAKDVVTDLNHDRLLWCNLPGGYGKNTGGYPGSNFDQDAFSMWNYTNIFGSWNYAFLQAPGSWVDAAHKNGTRIYGGIKFYESWNNDGSEAKFFNFISTKNDDGTYKYARAFVNAAAFFGNDGYNYNSEGTVHTYADWYNFHAAVNKTAENLGIQGFGIGQYTMNAAISTATAQQLYGTKDAKSFDCMLNYSGNRLNYRGVPGSLSAMESLGIPYDGVYQGQLLVALSSDYWVEMNKDNTKKMNICIWGEHHISRFFQFRVGTDPINVQENYQGLLEKAFTGANRNILNRPAMSNSWGSFQVASAAEVNQQLNTSPGLASMFPERTAIGPSLPFETHFNLGNGEAYLYKGKTVHGAWYNMSQQDIVPTYRWLVCAKGNMASASDAITPRFTYEDSYIGGSCLRLTGNGSTAADVVLYRTNLKATEGDVKVSVALKGNASGLKVILYKGGQWIEVPVGELQGKTWQEKELPVAGIAKGDVIEYIGLRTDNPADLSVLVGKLKVADAFTATPAEIDPKSLQVEVKEETAKSLSVKFTWEPVTTGFNTSVDKFGMVYNDEINVDHYQVLYKPTEDGKIVEMGRTAQWATLIANIPMDQTVTTAYIGVRAVSTDLKHYSEIQWVAIPRYTGTLPEVKEEDPYGASWMSELGANSGMEKVISGIWAEKITTTGATQNLNYTATANPDQTGNQYYLAEDHKLVLNQGQQISMTFKGYDSGTDCSLKYDFIYAYIDYDGNYLFTDADENIGHCGTMNAGTASIVNPGETFTFTVPADAHRGTSRLRFVACDAWYAHPGPTGGTCKGFTIDFPVEIQGSNSAERGPAESYLDRRDEGEPEEPEGLNATDPDPDPDPEGSINEVAAAGFSACNVDGDMIYFQNVDKAWIYATNGRMVKFCADGEATSISDLGTGMYLVKMLNGQIIRSQKVVIK